MTFSKIQESLKLQSIKANLSTLLNIMSNLINTPFGQAHYGHSFADYYSQLQEAETFFLNDSLIHLPINEVLYKTKDILEVMIDLKADINSLPLALKKSHNLDKSLSVTLNDFQEYRDALLTRFPTNEDSKEISNTMGVTTATELLGQLSELSEELKEEMEQTSSEISKKENQATKSYLSIERKLEKYHEQLNEFRDTSLKNTESLKKLNQDISSTERDLKVYIDSFHEMLEQEKTKNIKMINDLKRLYEKELNEQGANYVKKFKALESQYEESLDNLTKQQKNFIEELEKNHQTQIDTLNNDIKAIVESNQHEASTGVEKINKLVGIAANTSITGSFKDNAQRERTGADWNRYGSIASMVVSILAFVFYEAVFDFNADQELHHTIARFGLTFLLSLLAAYLARESSKHRQQQYNYQQIALEHEALSPYISDLPEEKQHELKIEMAKKLFPGTGNQSKTGTEGLPINIHDLFVELIKKADFKSSTQKESSSSNNAEQGKQTPNT